MNFYHRIGKRIFDVIVASIVLLTLSPLILLLALGVLIYLGRPIFFIQTRSGYHGNLFRLVKFRSMKTAFDTQGNLLPDSKRMTRFGKFLRSSSLDELPELWNVIKGEMSLVGPRPLLEEYLPLYSEEQFRRHDIKPGITGWAQINGRNAISWENKFLLDVWYVDRYSFLLDCKILWKTLSKTLRRKDINQEGEVTMKKFTGSLSK